MKRMITAKSEPKLAYNSHLDKSEWLPRLQVRRKDMEKDFLKNVDPKDVNIIQKLLADKILPNALTNSELRNNPYYDMEDKLIQLSKHSDDGRMYIVPYPGGGMFGTGNIYEGWLWIFDDGSIGFGENPSRRFVIDKYSPSTLKSYFYKFG